MAALGARLTRWLGRPLEARDRVGAADVIVVLGAPVRPDGSLSDVVAERVRSGVALWRAGIAPRLCMSGGRAPGSLHEVSEAAAMATYARTLGVPPEALDVEEESTNTSKNAKNVAWLYSGESGRRRVVVVTQPFHSRRARLWFKRAGFDAQSHHIADSLQYAQPRRALRWMTKEYVSLLRDLVWTRAPGDSRLKR